MIAKTQEKRLVTRLIRRTISIVATTFLAALIGAVVLLSAGINAPDWVRTQFQSQLNSNFVDSEVRIGEVTFKLFADGINPSLTATNIEFRDSQGQLRAALPEAAGTLSGKDLLLGVVRPVSIKLNRARLNLKRDSAGNFDLSIGAQDNEEFLKADGSIADALAVMESLFDIPVLAKLQLIEAAGTSVALDDQLSGRNWQFRDGILKFGRGPEDLSGSIAFKLEQAGASPADALFAWRKARGEVTSEFSFKFKGLRTEDIADQVATFDWLRVLDAPIAGSMTLAVQADGSFDEMNGVLDIGSGLIRQNAGAEPFHFAGAKAYLTYDQAEEKFTFSDITIDTEAARIKAEGHAYLSDQIDRTVGAIIGQLTFSQIRLNPEGIFETPLEFDLGAIDLRLRTNPLAIDIGQMVLVDGETSFVVKGKLKATDQGWASALDLSVNSLSHSRLMQLWPLSYKTKTRDWLKANVFAAQVSNVTGAIRAESGAPPRVTLGFDVSDINLRFMKTIPVLEDAIGYGVLNANKLDMVVQQGVITAPDGDQINAAGTSFHIPDVSIKKAPATVVLKTHSSIGSLLSVLDLPPFRFLAKAGLTPDIATGAVEAAGEIRFPLSKKVTLDQVVLSVIGTLKNVKSTVLIKGKDLTAKTLEGFVDNSGLTISGDVKVGAVPASGLWRQDFGPEYKGKSRVEGQIELSQAFLDEFGIALPKGSVSGRGTGHMTISLIRDMAPDFRLVSDLNRIGFALEPLGWKKAKNITGSLDVRGSFGSPAIIRSIVVKAPGLSAEGAVKLKGKNQLDVARFDKVNIDGWMETTIEIRTDTNGQAAFTVPGGVIDFRKSRFGSTTGTADSKGNRIKTRLDRLILSSGIVLTDVEGELNTAGGLTGSFSGKVNGRARIVGTLAPYNDGTAVRFTSKDAGAVMRSAGVFQSALGGRMDMVLTPTAKRGQYAGTLNVTNAKVKNANALAELLSALSVVGLLEQLSGEGISFSDIGARFLLTPTAVQVQQSSAVGVSLGITMEGNYHFETQNMNMQGVVTPIYLLNGILEQTKIFGGLFGKQRGEGLFGFNYTLKGPVDKPTVGVNPLSLLTPGLFREIFRQKIPDPPQ